MTNAAASLRYREALPKFLLGTGIRVGQSAAIGRRTGLLPVVPRRGVGPGGNQDGRRTGLTAGVGTGYEPTYLFGAFDSLDRNGVENPLEPEPPTADRAISLTAQRWLTNNASATLFRNLTSRQRLNLAYAGLWVQPVSGPGVHSQTHSVAVTHAWAPLPATGFELAYRYNRNSQTFEDSEEQPVDTHTVEGQFRHDCRLSTDRSISFMVGAGVVGRGRGRRTRDWSTATSCRRCPDRLRCDSSRPGACPSARVTTSPCSAASWPSRSSRMLPR